MKHMFRAPTGDDDVDVDVDDVEALKVLVMLTMMKHLFSVPMGDCDDSNVDNYDDQGPIVCC